MLLLVATLSLTFTACGGDDSDEPENPNNPENPDPSASSTLSVEFLKKVNCPYQTMSLHAVYDGEVYFSNGQAFAKYSPESDTWITLKPLSTYSSCLFVYQNRLFCAAKNSSYLEVYDKPNDSWSDATSFLGSLTNSIVGYFAVVDGKLYGINSYSVQVYNASTKGWDEFQLSLYLPENSSNIFSYNGCGYYLSDGSICEYNTETYKSFVKISCDYGELACAYNNSKMLIIGNSKTYLHLHLYSPATNDLQSYHFCNHRNHPEYQYCDIPIVTDKIVNINNRFFVGPENSKFYELKLNFK